MLQDAHGVYEVQPVAAAAALYVRGNQRQEDPSKVIKSVRAYFRRVFAG